jgi:DNA-binding FadR family transcriptional regulator
MNRTISLDVLPVRTERAFQIVANAIEEKVLSGQWPVGSALPGELALAEAFGVHRSTMREAIRALEQEGLLHRPQGSKQLLVNAPQGSHVASRMTAAMVLQEATFRELWETLLVLEPAAAEAAASRATEEELNELASNLVASRERLGDPKALVVLDMAFLAIIAKASRNRVLQLCRAPIGQLLYSAFMPVMRRGGAGPPPHEAHEDLLKALRDRQPEAARRSMHRHVIDFRRGYEAAGLDIDKPVGWHGSDSGQADESMEHRVP